MRKVKIFIAGSKKLVKHRNALRTLASELNIQHEKQDIAFYMFSFEDFMDRQDEYNNFIEHEADIVLIVLEDKIGDKTKMELLKAADTMKQHDRPGIIVLIKSFKEKEETADIAKIKGILEGLGIGQYYDTYTDMDSLKSKASKKISVHLEKHRNNKEKVSQPVTPELISGKKQSAKSYKSYIAVAIIFMLTLAGALLWHLKSTNDLLVFAGGGSVRNFIKEENQIDISDIPNSVYANIASGSAWSLLAEEASGFEEDEGKRHERFSIICLSADEIDSTFHNEKNQSLFKYARIVEYFLGYDPLVIYVDNTILKERNIPAESVVISVDSLRSLIKYALKRTDDMRIFTTSKTSGTLRAYQSLFTDEDSVNLEDMLDSKKTHLFYFKSSSGFITALDKLNGNKPFIILGSKYYWPEKLESANGVKFRRLIVKNGEDSILKPMYLYFIGKKGSEGSEYCTVKKPIIQFLKDIDASKNIKEDTWNDFQEGRVRINRGNLILKLNAQEQPK